MRPTDDAAPSVCKHGSLTRQCEICERDDRIFELEQTVQSVAILLREHERMTESNLRGCVALVKGLLEKEPPR